MSKNANNDVTMNPPLKPPTSSKEPDVEFKMHCDKLKVLFKDISITMNGPGCASYRRKVYKKELCLKHTYSYKCGAMAFLNTLVMSKCFKSRLICEIKKATDLLTDPFCELSVPQTVNYD